MKRLKTIFRHVSNLVHKIPWFKIQPRYLNKRKCEKLFLARLSFNRLLTKSLMVFSFLQKNVHFISQNSVLCLFLKNVLPSKRVVCFILNNLHFPMVEGIAFYALYKSRMLVIPCKAGDFCLFIGLPDEI